MAPRKVAVIGAGMVGIAAASWLQRDGHEVFVIDPNPPGHGASFGNAGCLNPSSVVPMSMPGMLRKVPRWLTDPLGPLAIRAGYLPRLAPWLVRFLRAGTRSNVARQARALRTLLHRGIETLAPLVAEAGAQHLVARVGHLYDYRSLSSFAADAPAWQLRRDNGVAWDEFDADGLRQLDPKLSHDYHKGVLVRENGHTTDPHGLVLSLARAFARDGGRIVRRCAVGFELSAGRLVGVRCADGLQPATTAVIAAGIWSRPLAAGLGDRIPLESERGYHVMLRGAQVAPRIPTADADGKFVVTPMREGLRVAGTVELAGVGAAPNWERARVLLRQAQAMYPALAGHAPEQVTSWMGHRPSTPDSLPVIGRSQGARDVVYAFGHGHIGMSCAANTGKAVAELICDEQPSIDLVPFDPRRFS